MNKMKINFFSLVTALAFLSLSLPGVSMDPDAPSESIHMKFHVHISEQELSDENDRLAQQSKITTPIDVGLCIMSLSSGEVLHHNKKTIPLGKSDSFDLPEADVKKMVEHVKSNKNLCLNLSAFRNPTNHVGFASYTCNYSLRTEDNLKNLDDKVFFLMRNLDATDGPEPNMTRFKIIK